MKQANPGFRANHAVCHQGFPGLEPQHRLLEPGTEAIAAVLLETKVGEPGELLA